MTLRDSLYRFLLVGTVAVVAIWGIRFLPQDDYQPSRPLYALAWLVVSIGFYVVVRKRSELGRSTAIALIAIFAFVLLASLLMR